MIRRIRLQSRAPQYRGAWQKAYYSHQKFWQRRRLIVLKAIWDGLTLAEVCRKTLNQWLDRYLHASLDHLLKRQPVHRRQRLSNQQQKILRFMIPHKAPVD